MPHYLDNIWGDQQVVRGFGDALNNNFAALVAARNQQRKQEQDAALNAAYYALERQKLMLQQPGMEAETAYRQAMTGRVPIENRLTQAQTDAQALQNEQAMRLAGQQKQAQEAASQLYLQTHPAMQSVPSYPLPQGPMMGPILGPVNQATPTEVPNFGRDQAATLQGLYAAQALANPGTSQRMAEPIVLRPGDVPMAPISGQLGQQVPGFVSPYQMMQYGLGQERQQTAEERAEEQARHNKAMEEKPGHESELDKLLKAAADKRKAGGTKTVRTQADFDALPSGTVYTGTDGKQYRKP